MILQSKYLGFQPTFSTSYLRDVTHKAMVTPIGPMVATPYVVHYWLLVYPGMIVCSKLYENECMVPFTRHFYDYHIVNLR